MEKEQEKEIIYKSLVELTKESESNRYFSRKRIFEHIKNEIEKEKGVAIHYRAGYSGNPHWNQQSRIDLDDVLPKQKTLPLSIEELVKEGKIQEIVTITQGGGQDGVKFYRAYLESN